MRLSFKKYSVQRKMLIVLGGGLLGFLIYFAFNQFILQQNRSALEKIVNVQLPSIEASENLIKEVSSLRLAMAQAVITQNFDGLGQSEVSHKKVIQLFTEWQKQSGAYSTVLEKLQTEYTASYSNLSEIMQNVVAGLATLSESQQQFQKEVAALSDIEQRLIKIKVHVSKSLQTSVVRIVNLGKRAIAIGVGLLFAGVGLSIGFYLMMDQVNKSLLHTNSGIQDTSRRLLEMVQEAQVSSQHLRSAANRQAASSTETMVSMEEMKRILAQTSRSSSDARDLSEASLTEATNGKDLVQALKDAMLEIENTNRDLQAVTEVVKVVRENTQIINDIVFKTQLLSFNANIEAARAGQHGLGFAVVANEIGNLAEMSGKAAEEINDLLEESTTKVDSTIGNTREKIAKANDLSARCYEFFKIITERSGQLKHMVNSISQATSEQNTGVEYVVSAMNELNQTASETDRMAQGMSMLADNLKSHSLNLNSAVENLNAIVQGQKESGQNGGLNVAAFVDNNSGNSENLRHSA